MWFTRISMLALALVMVSYAGQGLAGCSDVQQITPGPGGAGGDGGGEGGASGSGGMGGSGGNGGVGGSGGIDTRQPDLTIRSIGSPSISCPGGSGTCVTTVEIAIENLGDGDAPAFNFAVTLDPGQSVVVGQSVPGGLAAGISQLFTITTPPGGNCYDPDCTISVLVDDINDVVESDETNNTASSTTLG